MSDFCQWHAPDEFIEKPIWLDQNVTETELVDLLLEEPDNADHAIGGFIVLSGGRETVDDLASETTGFCFQRSGVSPEELGEGARQLSEEIAVREGLVEAAGEGEDEDETLAERVKKAGEKYLRDRCKGSSYTLMRKHYRDPICLPVNLFRFMVRHRGLTDYSVLHYAHYAEKPFLRPFLLKILQERFELKTRTDPGSKLKAAILKLFLNGWLVARKRTSKKANWFIFCLLGTGTRC